MVTCLITIVITPTTAQATSKPAVPQFSVQLIDYSYDIPPVYTTNPYTGEPITNEGYHVVNKTLEVTIKNQPFTPYTDENNRLHKLRYRIQYKGYFEENWGTFPLFKSEQYIIPSDSEYTTVYSSSGIIYDLNRLETGSKLDFRVEAVDGHMETLTSTYGMPIGEMFVADVSSGWSGIQTIIISDEPVSSSSLPQTTETIPQQSTIPANNNNNSNNYGSQKSQKYVIFNHPLFLFGVGALFGGVIVAAMLLVILKQKLQTLEHTDNLS